MKMTTVITFDLISYANSAEIINFDDWIVLLSNHIMSIGKTIADDRLQRYVREISPMTLTYERDIVEEFTDVPMEDKWTNNIKLFEINLTHRITESFKKGHTRRLIYFDDDYDDTTFSCISAIHFLLTADGWNMIVYQRASDLIKIKGDMKFLSHVLITTEKHLNIRFLKLIIHYGTIHCTNG